MRTISIRQTALVVTLLAAGAGAAAEPRTWDVPDAFEAVDVPGRTVVGGVPVAMHAVRSRQDAVSLQRHFRAEFKRAGLWLGPMTQLTRHLQVTGLDVDTLVAYSVFLQSNPDRTTTVILSETFIGEQAAQGELTFAPVMPAARSVMVARTEGVLLGTYRVKASAAEVRGFYAETMRKAGWSLAAPDRFERGAELVQLTAVAKGGECVVTLSYRER